MNKDFISSALTEWQKDRDQWAKNNFTAPKRQQVNVLVPIEHIETIQSFAKSLRQQADAQALSALKIQYEHNHPAPKRKGPEGP